MTPRGRLVSAAVAAALVAAGVLAATPAQADDTATVPGSAPSWLSKATKLGTPASTKVVTATIDLAPRGGAAALESFVASVSTPGSPSYHRFLTRGEYAARFDPTASTVTAVSALAKAAGFTVTAVAADRTSIDITGTVSAADKAFGAALTSYRHDGQTVVAPSRALRVPVALAKVITDVRGLDTTVVRMEPLSASPLATDVPPAAGYRNSTLCSTSYGSKPATAAADGSALPKFQGKTIPFTPCGYTGAQLRKAYEKTSTLTGKGVGVAIVDAYASPTITTDIKTYASRNGDPSYLTGQFTQSGVPTYTDTDASSCDAAGWFGEETLDIEAVHAMATGANIKYYAAKSCNNNDLLAALTKAVNDPAVKIVTNSWGSSSELLSTTGPYETLFKKAAAIGVTVLFSSGDSGDSAASFGIKTVGYPASSPNVTAVGGTATAISSTGAVTATNGWGTNKYTLSSDGSSWTSAGYLYGAGGGTSSVFSKPSYQSKISGTGRQVPDIAMNADPSTGMKIGQTQTFTTGVAYGEFRIGGTSLASPLVAGFTALAVQKDGAIGFANPTIYARTGAMTDVKDAFPDAGDVRADYTNGEDASGGYTYSVRTFGDDASLVTKAGYDNVTGLGVPNLAYLSIFNN